MARSRIVSKKTVDELATLAFAAAGVFIGWKIVQAITGHDGDVLDTIDKFLRNNAPSSIDPAKSGKSPSNPVPKPAVVLTRSPSGTYVPVDE